MEEIKALTTEELEFNARIAYNLKRLRAERNISQAELARAVGVSQSLLAMIESGARTLTAAMGNDLAKALGCTLQDIVRA